ncbi:hypothetical protein M501DRAFT_18614 [Patellaria atrata CBS 101060]|uniref:Large ribosomal subunit protein mL59 domain-containing protein n=1 Tax=Patellaria atrata CBS 101060 TaxID=1346257 RepID=A0A9P4SHR7_9PEZI|nr:hypothetical protein M501DRAFT_18614 [Patellaria atrata CBS 101060]
MAHLDPSHIRLAQRLPLKLQNFFRKYPPPLLFPQKFNPALAEVSPSTTSTTSTVSTTAPTDPNASTTEHPSPSPSSTTPLPAEIHHNPFSPFLNLRTGRWRGPLYSLRRQADLCKLALKHNVLDLLPPSKKNPLTKAQKREERGLRVRGTGVGQVVKGKKWERTMEGRLEKRREAMMGMGEMVRLWKEKGHGRGWKKWPK